MKRHSMDAVSLVFGLLFLAVAGWWVAARFLNLDWNVPNFGWIAAGALILLGLLGVMASLRSGDTPDAPAAQRPTAGAPTAGAPTAEAPTAEAPTAEASKIDEFSYDDDAYGVRTTTDEGTSGQ